MKKILLVVPLSTLDFGKLNAGGVDSVCQMLVGAIVARCDSKYHYRVLAFDPFSNVEYSGKSINLTPNIEVIMCPVSERFAGIKLPRFISNPIRVMSQAKCYKPDIIHAHADYWLIGAPRKTYRVATLHSYKKLGRKPVSFLNDQIYVNVLTRLSRFFIDYYTSVGVELQESIRYDTKKPVDVIYNPIDASFIKLARNKISSDSIALVTCALISRKKRIHIIINLVKALVDLGLNPILKIIGPNVDRDYFNELKELIKNNDIERNVVFTGGLCKELILEEYSSSDVGVFASEEETFGLVPLEMIASGLPVIATRVGILKEIEGYIHDSAFTLIDANVEYYDPKLVLDLIGQKGGRNNGYIAAEFAASSIITQYEVLYEQLLGV